MLCFLKTDIGCDEDVPKLKKSKFERSWSIDMDSVNDDDIDNDSDGSSEIGKIREHEEKKEIRNQIKRRKSSVSLDDNFLSQMSEESVLQQ